MIFTRGVYDLTTQILDIAQYEVEDDGDFYHIIRNSDGPTDGAILKESFPLDCARIWRTNTLDASTLDDTDPVFHIQYLLKGYLNALSRNIGALSRTKLLDIQELEQDSGYQI